MAVVRDEGIDGRVRRPMLKVGWVGLDAADAADELGFMHSRWGRAPSSLEGPLLWLGRARLGPELLCPKCLVTWLMSRVPTHPPSYITPPCPRPRPLRPVSYIATMHSIARPASRPARGHPSRTMLSLARLAPGHTLPGARWDYRIVKAVKGDNTHRSAVFMAKVLPHDDVPNPPQWFVA